MYAGDISPLRFRSVLNHNIILYREKKTPVYRKFLKKSVILKNMFKDCFICIC